MPNQEPRTANVRLENHVKQNRTACLFFQVQERHSQIGCRSSRLGVAPIPAIFAKRSPTEKKSSSKDLMWWPYPISVTTPPANLDVPLSDDMALTSRKQHTVASGH